MTWHKIKVHTAVLECNPSGIYGKKRHGSTYDVESGEMHSYNLPIEKIRTEELQGFYTTFVGTAYRDWADEVHVKIDVQQPLAKSAPRKDQGRPDTQKPDADNIAKLVLDTLNGLAWHDDCQITDLHIKKHPRFFRRLPYLRVEITYIKNERKESE